MSCHKLMQNYIMIIWRSVGQQNVHEVFGGPFTTWQPELSTRTLDKSPFIQAFSNSLKMSMKHVILMVITVNIIVRYGCFQK